MVLGGVSALTVAKLVSRRLFIKNWCFRASRRRYRLAMERQDLVIN